METTPVNPPSRRTAALVIGLMFAVGTSGIPFGPSRATAAPPPPETSCDAWALPDVDGNCDGDVVLGAPDWDSAEARNAGAVAIIHAAGLGSPETTLVTARMLGFADEAGARFGAAIAIGDLDGDRVEELVIGAPGSRDGNVRNAGAVYIVWSFNVGPTRKREPVKLFARDLGLPIEAARFGSALAYWGTIRHRSSATDRLVIGAPYATVEGESEAGAAAVVDGHSDEIALDQVISQGSRAPGRAESGDHFGAALSITDLWDLVVGVPEENVGSVVDAGAVALLPRDSDALGFSQGSAGVPGTSEKGDRFGQSVSGYTGHRLDDETDVGFLASAPGEDVGRIADAGAITAFYAWTVPDEPVHTWSALPFVITADTRGFPGQAEKGDRLGSALYGTVIGIPAEDVGSRRDSGAVCVLDPTSLKLKAGVKARCFDQTTPGISGAANAGDRFGAAVAEFCSGHTDVCSDTTLVGVPGEDVGSNKDAGRVLSIEVDHRTTDLPLPRQSAGGWGSQFWSY